MKGWGSCLGTFVVEGEDLCKGSGFRFQGLGVFKV